VFLQHCHLQPPELRNKLGDWIGESHFALFHEHQNGNAGDGLRHGCNPEQGVFGHRLLGFKIHRALRFEVRDPPFARYQGNRT
jgi:hypothetical protein